MTDLSGQEFGWLTVVRLGVGPVGAKVRRYMPRYWFCRCRCGEYLDVCEGNLKRKGAVPKCKKCGSGKGGLKKLANALEAADVAKFRGGVRRDALAKAKGVCGEVMGRWLVEEGVVTRVEGKQKVLMLDEDKVARVVAGGGEVEVMAGKLGVGKATMTKIVRGAGGGGKGDEARARKVWKLAAGAMSEREIAAEIGVSKNRVLHILAWALGRRVSDKVAKLRERMWLERTRTKENEE